MLESGELLRRHISGRDAYNAETMTPINSVPKDPFKFGTSVIADDMSTKSDWSGGGREMRYSARIPLTFRYAWHVRFCGVPRYMHYAPLSVWNIAMWPRRKRPVHIWKALPYMLRASRPAARSNSAASLPRFEPFDRLVFWSANSEVRWERYFPLWYGVINNELRRKNYFA